MTRSQRRAAEKVISPAEEQWRKVRPIGDQERRPSTKVYENIKYEPAKNHETALSVSRQKRFNWQTYFQFITWRTAHFPHSACLPAGKSMALFSQGISKNMNNCSFLLASLLALLLLCLLSYVSYEFVGRRVSRRLS